MAEIVKFRFEDTFADKTVELTKLMDTESDGLLRRGHIINNHQWGTTFIQFRTAEDARSLINRGGWFEAVMISGRKFQTVRDQLDWSCIDLGPAIMIDTLDGSLPDWRELRPWIEDSLEGLVSVFLGGGFKRFSFDDPGDYFLFKLMWT